MGRIPEMGYRKAIRFSQLGSYIGSRYPRCVGGEDGFRRAVLLDPVEKFPFEFQVLRNRFDDQICSTNFGFEFCGSAHQRFERRNPVGSEAAFSAQNFQNLKISTHAFVNTFRRAAKNFRFTPYRGEGISDSRSHLAAAGHQCFFYVHSRLCRLLLFRR